MIETWMHTCLESPVWCKQPETLPSYRPTRLIKLNGMRTFRLVSGTDCEPAVRYAALSYCWGGKPAESMLRLVQSNVSDLTQEQLVEGLPKTFRDAVAVAQHFGVSYLWIDRLCIIQDCGEDWRRESSTMQDVYKNALFSISALGAKDDDGGCFFQRDPSAVVPTVLRLRLEEDGDEKTFIATAEQTFCGWLPLFEHEPLLERSWVVQERLLAPRTLHFGTKQVFWECREKASCETHPDSIYTRAQYNNARDEDEAFPWKQLLDIEPSPFEDISDPSRRIFFEWDRLVEFYAGRKLTVARDKLPALSGLANATRARLQKLKPGPHRYLAGLWEENLMKTLLWEPVGPRKRPSTYRAPSWSWACLDGQVRTGNIFRREAKDLPLLASMISGETVLVDKDACDTGQVDGGVLTLRGPCAHVFIDIVDHWPFRTDKLTVDRDIRSIRRPHGRYQIEQPKRITSSWANAVFDTLEDIRGQALLLWVETYSGPGKCICRGLLLALGDNHKYRRLGLTDFVFKSRKEAEVFVGEFPQMEIDIV
ncbi:heterokaryon incompatibility protein [Colletotrichum musicola]|uniref:Heterokaryon incompatibility protein n=1 Tax=Colletotrichum musicola TaxID=2175873 RepID=A0A8H6NUU5_9PEZI|nr:heterokaryon incompatibility protein [Colletotrichum musicola]